MPKIIFFFFILILFVAFSASELISSFSWTKLIVRTLELIPILGCCHIVLSKNSVPFYLFWCRVKSWIINPISKWGLLVIFSGKIGNGNMIQFREFILHKTNFPHEVQIIKFNESQLIFDVDKTLRFEVCNEGPFNIPDEFLDDDFCSEKRISISMSKIDLRFRDSKRKLKRQIIPILEEMRAFFSPQVVGYELSIFFERDNPFYSIFLQDLNAEFVDDFKIALNFQPDKNSQLKDNVKVTKNRIDISSPSALSLDSIAEDFIFLSPNISALKE